MGISSRRLIQVFHFGWKDACAISRNQFRGKQKLSIYFDIIRCYFKYGIWSNQYVHNKMWLTNRHEREQIGKRIQAENKRRDEWLQDSLYNQHFLSKWTKRELGSSAKGIRKRVKAYTKRYNIGNTCQIKCNVILDRHHYLSGTVTIGNNVLLSEDVHIDYSGFVTISDDVKLSSGVILESHKHEFIPGANTHKATQTTIIIENGVWVGQRAVICEDCKRIGRYAQIGAGAVVRNPIPPYAMVVGNPAKIVGFLYTPDEVAEFEKDKFSESDKTNIDKYKIIYDKYFINRISEIKKLLNN